VSLDQLRSRPRSLVATPFGAFLVRREGAWRTAVAFRWTAAATVVSLVRLERVAETALAARLAAGLAVAVEEVVAVAAAVVPQAASSLAAAVAAMARWPVMGAEESVAMQLAMAVQLAMAALRGSQSTPTSPANLPRTRHPLAPAELLPGQTPAAVRFASGEPPPAHAAHTAHPFLRPPLAGIGNDTASWNSKRDMAHTLAKKLCCYY
jgi:hypothetical protein